MCRAHGYVTYLVLTLSRKYNLQIQHKNTSFQLATIRFRSCEKQTKSLNNNQNFIPKQITMTLKRIKYISIAKNYTLRVADKNNYIGH